MLGSGGDGKSLNAKNPRSPQAADALWHAAFYRSRQVRFKGATPLLEKLQREYSNSPRAKSVSSWIANLG